MVETVSNEAKESTDAIKPGFFSGTKLYLLDFIGALLLLGVSAILLAMCYGYLFSQVGQNFGTGQWYSGIGTGAVWAIASLVVWLPFGIIFFLRARGQEVIEPVWRQNVARKVLVIIYRTLTLITAVGFAFAALYSALQLAITPSMSIPGTLIGSVLPSILSALTFGALWFAFTGSDKPNRKTYAGAFIGVSFAVVVGLFIVTAINARANTRTDQCSYGSSYDYRNCHNQYEPVY